MPKRLTKEEFIERAEKVHNNKYDYSKVEYVNNSTKVCVQCPEHGEFWITPDSLFRGRGCPLCGTRRAQMKNRMKQDVFLLKAKKVHNNKYDYKLSKYENTDTKICIICPIHGEFWQTPHHHLNGHGCPHCGRNNISENKIYNYIKKNFNDAISQYNADFLIENGYKQYIDIYIPSKKIGIEYQGRQHFIPITAYGGEYEFNKTKERDFKKFYKCLKHGVKIFYCSYEKEIPDNYFDIVYNNENNLIEAINNYDNKL